MGQLFALVPITTILPAGSQLKEVGDKRRRRRRRRSRDERAPGELSRNTHRLTLLHPSQRELSIQLCPQSGP
ncbi:hypothetical protein EYF80_017430 [Liparis tanakae]|uniref:Uncharacterized protein n=1 Tax=Liparis tanakae TaxID=230148 RepID=A0A4Z2I3Q7_9TELE|nr:hypothetical protein EYF80_017430 [Liparis tanakae]